MRRVLCMMAAGLFGLALFAPRAEAVQATGGTVTNYIDAGGTNWIAHIFTSSGVFTNLTLTSVQVLVVAGGGGGGGKYNAGGGGAGGLIYSNAYPVVGNSNYTVTVGIGGAGGGRDKRGFNGSNSLFGAIEATGGGGGGGWSDNSAGQPGGSGGGASGYSATAYGNNFPAGQGNRGGVGGSYGGGGGGGAGSIGLNGIATTGGAGGTGMVSSISGGTNYYAGGGGGAGYSTGALGGTGGLGGGGKGADYELTASNGVANTGGGGGGASGYPYDTGPASGGNGGSGIVIVRYLGDTSSLTIQNSPATSVTTNSATFNGLLTSTGSSACAVCVYWGTDANAWANTNWFNGGAVNDAWTNNTPFSTNISLSPKTTYYYTYAASNATTNVVAGAPVSVMAIYLPAVTNLGATLVDGSSALLRGRVTDTGGETPRVWFQYWLAGDATTNPIDGGVQGGSFSNTAAGLLAGSNYAYQILASNSAGVVLSGVQTFTTLTGTYWYVATFGSDTNAGTNWATAFATVSNGVAHATNGQTVMVMDGTYNLSDKLVVTNAIALRSVNGASTTTLRVGGALEIVNLNNAGAAVDGFRMTGSSGLGWTSHGAVKVQAGTLRNCLVDGNRVGGGGGVDLIGGLVAGCTIITNTATASSDADGAGVYMTGGVLSNCVVAGNIGEDGGGIFMTAGLVTHCIITNNVSNPYSGTPTDGGGGVRMSGGVLANCLVARNRIGISGFTTGGGVKLAGGSIINCTIADNSNAGGAPGSGLYMTAGAVTNSIIYYNSALFPATGQENVNASGGSIVYSCTQPLTNAPGNIALSPDFVDRAGGNYRLQAGSACIDAGTNLVSVATDLDGGVRPKDGDGNGTALHDMGCYEAEPSASFQCSFSGTPVTGLFSLEAVFTAQVSGPGTDVVTYAWDYTNDGTNELVGTPYAVVTNTYGVGIHSVKLTCVNSLNQTATVTRTGYLTVYSDLAYVTTNGAHVAPYDTWAKAATNIQAALNAVYSPGTVYVSNGVYTLGQALDLSRAVTLVATNGVSNTTLRVSGAVEILNLNHAGGVVDGFRLTGSSGLGYTTHGAVKVQAGTLRNCLVDGNRVGGGGGVHLIGGLVAGCTIITNTATSTSDADGAGVYMTGGVLSNCVVAGNSGEDGGGVFMTAGLVTHCIITNNLSNPYSATDGGGGVRMSGGTLVNCLVARNRIINTGFTTGGGVKLAGGSIVNCTIADNSNAGGAPGSGLYMTAGAVTNSIVYYNSTLFPATGQENVYATGGSIVYSCTQPLTNAPGNISADPLFVNATVSDYHLRSSSPCINAGMNMAWLDGGVDLGGQPRVKGGWIDMGAYELPPVRGTVFTIQ